MMDRTHVAAAHPRLGLTGIAHNDVQVLLGMHSIGEVASTYNVIQEVCMIAAASRV